MRDESFEPSDFLEGFNLEFAKHVRFAFKPKIAYEIGRRARWTCCCGCGRRFQDGWLVEAAHKIGTHQPTPDGNIDHGELRAKVCHLQQHIEELQKERTWTNIRAVELASQRAFQSGFHTYRVYEEHPEQLDQDRQELFTILTDSGLDVREYVLNLGNPEEII